MTVIHNDLALKLDDFTILNFECDMYICKCPRCSQINVVYPKSISCKGNCKYAGYIQEREHMHEVSQHGIWLGHYGSFISCFQSCIICPIPILEFSLYMFKYKQLDTQPFCAVLVFVVSDFVSV